MGQVPQVVDPLDVLPILAGACAPGAAGRLQFWDVDSAETLLYLYAFGPGQWLALLPDGRFDASPEALRWLCYTEQGTLNSFTAEELLAEFYSPQAVREVLARYGGKGLGIRD